MPALLGAMQVREDWHPKALAVTVQTLTLNCFVLDDIGESLLLVEDTCIVKVRSRRSALPQVGVSTVVQP